MIRQVVAVAACMALALPAYADDPLPPLVLHVQSQIRESCEGKVEFDKDFITTANFSPDGKPDYILNYGKLDCNGHRAWFCGSGGCTIKFIVSSGYTYVDTDIQMQGYKVIPRADGDIIEVGLHGSACGRSGADACESLLFWRRGKFASRN